jgi:hypothetical protein
MTKDFLAPESEIARNPNFISADVGKEAVLLDVDSGQLLQLNKTAASIWRLLESPMRFDGLCDQLSQTFDNGDQDICDDVAEFLADMQAQNSVLVSGRG